MSRRYGRFVDRLWIQSRMRQKDARVERATAARTAAATPARLLQTLVADVTAIYPAGTDPQVILAAAQAALAKAGAR